MTTPQMVTTPTKADPKRPYKAIAAAVGAGIATLLSLGLELPHWLLVVLTVLAAGIGAFLKSNPLVGPGVPPRPRRNQRVAPRPR